MKKFKFDLKKLIPSIFILLLIMSQNAFSQVNITPTRTDVSGFPTWTDTDVSGTSYLQLLIKGANTITPAMNFDGYTNETLDFKARTYGTASDVECTLTISISTNNGSTWSIIKTIIPSNSTMTAQTQINLSSYSGSQVKVKFSVEGGTSNTIGVGIDDINIKGIEAACNIPTTQAMVTSFTNTGLDNMTINWTKGDGENTMVYVNTQNSFTNPIDGIEGTANTVYTSGEKIVYAGSGTSVTVTGLQPSTLYYVQIYTYNCSGALTKYLTTLVDNYGSETTTGYCTSATTQSSSIVASPTANSISLSWTKGNGDYRVVIATKNPAGVTAVPINGTTYTANSTFGNGTQIATGEYVVYKGTGTSVTVTGLLELTKYYFTIYEFCAPTGAGSESYLTLNPATKNVTTLSNAPSTCFEIESILVDACARESLGYTEGPNEMVRFKIGNTPLDAYNLNMPKLCNNTWQGIEQTPRTAFITSELNKTITSSCGILIEPPGGILPARSNVLLLTSSDTESGGYLYFDLQGNSFSTLTDTLYVIYQKCNTSNLGGHFTNTGAPKTYDLTISFSTPVNCSDMVSYDRSKLVGDGAIPVEHDGDRVDYDWDNTPHYVNNGCNAPLEPTNISVSLAGDASKIDFCADSPIPLLGKIVGNVGVVTSTEWSGGNGGTFVAIDDTITYYYPSPTESGSTKFTFTAQTTGCTGGVLSDDVFVNIWPYPTTVPTASPNPIQGGQTSTLTANASGGSGSYSYSWTPTASISGSTTGSTATTAALTQTTDFTVAVTDTKSGCPAVDSTVTVVVITGDLTMPIDGVICEGESYTLHAYPGYGTKPYTYNWASNPVGAIANPTDSVQIVSPTFIGVTTFSLTVTDANSIEKTGTVTVTVKEKPVIDLGGPYATCGPAVTLDPNPSVVYGSYLWSDNSTSPTLSISSTGNATVNYSVTVTENSCESIDNTDVTISSTPTVTITGDTEACDGETITLTANPSNATSYEWNGVIGSNTLDVTTSGTYSVVADFGGCTDTDQIIVTINPKPNPSIVGNLCESTSTTLSISGSNVDAGATISWTPTEPTSISTTAGDVYTAIVTNLTGCDGTVSATILANPTPDLGPDQSVCLEDAPVTLDAGPGSSYVWTGTSSSSQNAIISTEGTHNISVIVTASNGCTGSDNVEIIINPMPNQPTTPVPFDEGEDTEVTLDAENSGSTYLWYASNHTSQTETVSAEEKDYIVLITNEFGCPLEATISVIRRPANLEPYNVITPNKDGSNDVWYIDYIEYYDKAVVNVYNRNGNNVFNSNGYLVPWNGNLYNNSNQPVPAGVYFYVIDMSAYPNYEDTKKNLKGTITVIKE